VRPDPGQGRLVLKRVVVAGKQEWGGQQTPQGGQGRDAGAGVRLFTRTARGARLTIDGQAFLPHARDLLQAAERAAASVRPGHRALRVDVINPRIAPACLLRDFHRAHPEIELDVVTHLLDVDAAIAAVRSGVIDASFRAVTVTAQQLPGGVLAARALDDPLQLLTGPAHKLASSAAKRRQPRHLTGSPT